MNWEQFESWRLWCQGKRRRRSAEFRGGELEGFWCSLDALWTFSLRRAKVVKERDWS